MNEVATQRLGEPIDYIVILVYFLGVVGFGMYFSRYTRSTKDFFFGGQRFAWWLIAFSGIATTVGSYSFVKYSDVGFKYGVSSTQTYLNDWFWMPILMLVWLPIIYYQRVVSVPEYFERRFGRASRVAATVLLTSEALRETTIWSKPIASSCSTAAAALSTRASGVGPPKRRRIFFSSEPALTPIRRAQPASPAFRATSRILFTPPMLPGLILTLSAPASIAIRARR